MQSAVVLWIPHLVTVVLWIAVPVVTVVLFVKVVWVLEIGQ